MLEADRAFQWGDAEQKAFEDLKTLISEDQLLRFFDITKPVVIQCNTRKEGLGAAPNDSKEYYCNCRYMIWIIGRYHPGNQQVIADALSRFPVEKPLAQELT